MTLIAMPSMSNILDAFTWGSKPQPTSVQKAVFSLLSLKFGVCWRTLPCKQRLHIIAIIVFHCIGYCSLDRLEELKLGPQDDGR